VPMRLATITRVTDLLGAIGILLSRACERKRQALSFGALDRP